MPLQSPQLTGSPRLEKAVTSGPPIAYGEGNEGVAKMQKGLIDAGYPMPNSTAGGTKPPDGIYGSETLKQLKKFQSDNSLKADGLAGPMTLNKLDQMLLATNYNVALENARIAAEMAGPPGSRPFAATTTKKI